VVRIVGSTRLVTVQMHPVDAQDLETRKGTGFNPLTSWIGPQMRSRNSQPGATVREKIQEIRHAFGLNIKQFSEVMQVTRVTIYDWLRQDNMSILREAARKRLNQVHVLATVWTRLQPIPGLYLDESIEGGAASLFSQLKGDELPTPQGITNIHHLLLQACSIEKRPEAYVARRSESLAQGVKKILGDPQDYGLEMD
jgi:hypothetical protein